MTGHDDIKKLLSAAAGGDLSEDQLRTVERHLADCPECRSEFAELRLLIGAMKKTPELDPPPWLAGRIMARIKDEAGQEPGWLARLFLPLHVKLPLEAFALVMICVTAWYVMQDVELSAPQKMPEVASSAKTEAVAPAAEKQLAPPSGSEAVPVQTEKLQPASQPPVGTPSKPDIMPMERRSEEPQQIQQQTAPSFAPPPERQPAAPSVAEEKSRAASESLPAPSLQHREQASGAASAPAAERRKSAMPKSEMADQALSATAAPLLRIRLYVENREEFTGRLRTVARESGGTVVSIRTGNAVVRIDSSRLPELQRQLALSGRLTEQPALDAGRRGVVELSIFW